MKRIILTLLSITFSFPFLSAQLWLNEMGKPNANFYDVQAAFETEWANKPYQKGKGYKQFKRWEWLMEQRIGPNGEMPDPMALFTALKERRSLESSFERRRAAGWSSLGPASVTPQAFNPGNGRVNVVTEDPNDPSTIYVGTPAGGIWKTTNDGASWTPLFDDMVTLAISGIVIDPNNSQIVYAATGDGDGGDMSSIGVVKSTDGGQNWNLTGLNFIVTASRRTHRLIMDPTNSSILFCAAENGLYKTEDAGTTWTRVMSGNIRDVKFKPGDPTTVYATTKAFHLSTDGGTTFSSNATGLPPAENVNRIHIGVSADDPAVVYLVCGNAINAGFLGLWRSSDAGATFTQRSSTPNIFGLTENGSDNGGQSWYDMAIDVNPTNVNDVYVGGINVWRSTNGGQNWTISSHWVFPSSIGYVHADIHYLKFYGNRLYCGSDGGIFRRIDNGAWADLSQGLEITQFYRLGGSEAEPELIAAGAQDNGSNIRDSSGWTHVFGSDGAEAMIDPSNPSVIFCSFQNGNIVRSLDGGQSFSNVVGSINEDGAFVTPYMFDPSDPSKIYAGFENLWFSDDQGSTWANLTNQSFGTTIRSLAVASSNPNYVYFGNRAGYIRKTTDGGATFSVIDNGIPRLTRTYISVDATDENIVYVSLGGFEVGEKVYKSIDGGASWINISGNLPNAPVNCIVSQTGSNGGIYAATDVGVFYTDNNLSAWQPYSDGMPNTLVMELEINYATNKIRAATFGRGIWESPLYTSSNSLPVVSFNWDSDMICQDDSIQFFDNSLEASVGWSWSFPGGMPATSTLQSPKVFYPVSGNYQVSLSMSNNQGSSSFMDNVDVDINPHMVFVNITVDDFPQETTWNIIDDDQQVVGAGGPYGAPSESTVSTSLCLDDGCYAFEIFDSFGDGICCTVGQGAYNVSTLQLGNFATGGQFTSIESTQFCLTGATNIKELDTKGFSIFSAGENGVYTVVDQLAIHELTYVLYDTSGRVLENRKTPPAKQIRIDLRPFAKGAYLLHLHAGDRVQVLRVTN